MTVSEEVGSSLPMVVQISDRIVTCNIPYPFFQLLCESPKSFSMGVGKKVSYRVSNLVNGRTVATIYKLNPRHYSENKSSGRISFPKSNFRICL